MTIGSIRRGADVSLHPEPERATHVPSGDGVRRVLSRDLYVTKLRALQTGGRLGLVHATVPPGEGPPPHVHVEHDELFYVLAGELEFLDGQRTFRGGPGDAVFLPRGHRHRFRNVGDTDAVMLFVYTPSGVEEGFIDAGDEPVGRAPRQEWSLERIQRAFAAMGRHDTLPARS
jgi:quercetin dioxygenase-like cupin family protein